MISGLLSALRGSSCKERHRYIHPTAQTTNEEVGNRSGVSEDP